MASKNFINELRWRGMLHDCIPGTEELLSKGEVVKGYIGFDPTADSLGVGNMVQVMTLLHFQQCGHKPVALIGGATGMVGDPSGKSSERNLLDTDLLIHNQECQQKQLEKFLDFNCGEQSAQLVNNYDWFKNINFLDFIRDIGKHISVNYMMAKDSVKNRIDGNAGGEGMSFTEFTYQLIQGYDFYHLNKTMGCKLQMGGSDQWGNITTGTELIRRKGGGEAYALTTQLIKKADGTKFGKTESGNIWLDANKTSPYKFYQFWLNGGDADAETYMKIFSLKGEEEINALVEEHNKEKHLRKLQKALAEEVTTRVHSKEHLKRAQETSDILFGTSFEDFKKLTPVEIEGAFDEKDTFRVTNEIFQGVDTVSLLGEKTQVYPSKSETKKALQGNAVSVNKEKIAMDRKLAAGDLLYNKYLLVQKGKRNYYLLIVE